MLTIEEICQNIRQQLEKHGFPEKKVSFPEAQITRYLTKYDFELEDLIRQFSADDILVSSQDQKLLFSVTTNTSSAIPGMDNLEESLDALKHLSPEELRRKAEEIQKSLTPEQQQKIMEMFNQLSPEEKQKIMSRFAGS